MMLRISDFGQTGPMREVAGFGAIAESIGGMRYVTGFPDRPPGRGPALGEHNGENWVSTTAKY